MKNVVLIEKITAIVPNKYEAIRIIAKEAGVDPGETPASKPSEQAD